MRLTHGRLQTCLVSSGLITLLLWQPISATHQSTSRAEATDSQEVAELLESLATLEAAPDPNEVLIADTLFRLGTTYFEADEVVSAIPVVERVRALLDLGLEAPTQEVVNILHGVGWTYYRTGSFAEALPLLQRVLALREAASDPNSLSTARTQRHLGYVYIDAGSFAEAIPLLRQALATYDAGPEANESWFAGALASLARAYQQTAKHAEAIPLLRRALAIYDANPETQQPVITEALRSLGNAYGETGDYASAIPAFNRALALYEMDPDTHAVAIAGTLRNLAFAYEDTGNSTEAIPYFRRYLEFLDADPAANQFAIAKVLSGLGLAYLSTADDAQAIPLFHRALTIYDANPESNPDEVVTVLYSLGLAYLSTTDDAQAIPLLHRALTIYDANPEANPATTALMLYFLGTSYQQTFNHPEAIPPLRRALEIFDLDPAANQLLVAETLYSLGFSYNRTDRYAEATPLLRRALAIHEADHEIAKSEPGRIGEILRDLGQSLRNTDDTTGAIPFLQRAVVVFEEVNEANPEGKKIPFVQALNELGSTYNQMANYAEALPPLQRALGILDADPEDPMIKESLISTVLSGLGLAYGGMRRSAEGLPLQRRNLQIQERAFRTDPEGGYPSFVLGLRVLASSLTVLGEHDEATSLMYRALVLEESNPDTTPASLAEAHSHLAFTYHSANDYTEAISLYHRALALKEANTDTPPASLAETLRDLASSYEFAGSYAEATPLLRRALAIYETDPLTNQATIAGTLALLGDNYLAMENTRLAVPIIRRAIELWETDPVAYQDELYDGLLALTYSELLSAFFEPSSGVEDLTGALVSARRALKFTEQSYGADSNRVHHNLFILGAMLSATPRWISEAITVLQRALELTEPRRESNDPTDFWGDVFEDNSDRSAVFTLELLGNLYNQLGDTRASIHAFRRAVALEVGGNRIGNSLDGLLRHLFSSPEFLTFTGDVSITEFTSTVKYLMDAPGRGQIDPSFNLPGFFPSGREYLSWQAKFRAVVVLGVLEQLTGERDPDILPRLHELRRIAERESRFEVYFLFLIADRHHKEGRISEATAAYERALALFEQTAVAGEAEFFGTSLGTALYALGDVPRAIRLWLAAAESERTSTQSLISGLPERQAVGVLQPIRSAVRTPLDLALSAVIQDGSGDLGTVWDAVIRKRPLLLDELLFRHRIAAGSVPELGRRVAALTTAREELAQLLVQAVGTRSASEERALIEAALQKRERAETTLAEAIGASQYEQERESAVGWAEVTAGLSETTALVAFTKYSLLAPSALEEQTFDVHLGGVPSYLAFVQRGSQPPVVVPIGPEDDLVRSVDRWHREAALQRDGVEVVFLPTEDDERAYREAGVTLRQLIWDPLVPHLAGAERVFVVPDGPLNTVNLASLPLGEDAYLIEQDLLIHYVANEQDLVTFGNDAPAGTGLLALGAPTFEATAVTAARAEDTDASVGFSGRSATCDAFTSLQWAPLPGTATEISNVVGSWAVSENRDAQTVFQFTGAGATERAFKQHAPGRRVLHLATHGFFLSNECSLSSPETSPFSETDPPPVNTRAENPSEPMVRARRVVEEMTDSLLVNLDEDPLVLSGLALATANARDTTDSARDDGILTAEEVAAMDLSGVEWAVLSACETAAVGAADRVTTGESLRRAFQAAGVQTLIMSLWDVADAPTQQWMTTLYQQRFEHGVGTAEAVRHASLQMLRDRRDQGLTTHPFFWAPFIAVGDWQ